MTDTTNIETSPDEAKKSARALILEKARAAKAEKQAKEEAAKEAQKTLSENGTARKTARKRRTRRGPLEVPEDMLDLQNYVYRWVEDTGWSVSEKQGYGYEFVEDRDGKFASVDLVIRSGKFGSVVGRTSSRDGKISYLMRMDKEEYIEAKKALQEDNDRILHDEAAEVASKDLYQKKYTIGTKDQDY